MKLNNICGFNSITEYVQWKLDKFSNKEKSFGTLFNYMFSEAENTMAELSDGYRIKKISYGEMKLSCLQKAAALAKSIKLEHNSIVGIYMDNSTDWIASFWAVLICGYKPLLMNKRIQKEVLEQVICEYNVGTVISDEEIFTVNTLLSSNIVFDENTPEITPHAFGDEVIFMSSGTTDKIKLCAYTAENFYYQLGNSVDIVNKCPEISRHYNGELKLLTLLPFYHVFGFIAVYLWFGFFSRTFVFLKDMNPKTIQSTVKKHQVTHIFAVPLVWDSVYKAALRTIRKKGDKTYEKFCRAIKMSNAGGLSRKLVYKGLDEVREKLFGNSICFLISGGGHISTEALEFYNGIGYHIANGYGMTEVGITSVDISHKSKVRNYGSIGSPFKHTEYAINECGELLIKGKNMASRICQGVQEKVTDFNEWFNSFDIVKKEDNRYYLLGRSDDLIVSKSGENLNPQLIETSIKLPDAEEICLFSCEGIPILIISSRICYSKDKTRALLDNAKKAIMALGLEGEIHRILVTPDSLMAKDEFKISRKRIAKRYAAGEFTLIDEASLEARADILLGGIEADVRRIFAEVLQIAETDIHPDASFFADLGGSSIDYFVLADAINSEFGVDIKLADGKTLHTVNEICSFIREH